MGSLTTEAGCPVRSSAAVTRTVTAALGTAARITDIVVGVADPLKTAAKAARDRQLRAGEPGSQVSPADNAADGLTLVRRGRKG